MVQPRKAFGYRPKLLIYWVVLSVTTPTLDEIAHGQYHPPLKTTMGETITVVLGGITFRPLECTQKFFLKESAF
jgi:hypothetical protein